jgi:hypothetical protein
MTTVGTVRLNLASVFKNPHVGLAARIGVVVFVVLVLFLSSPQPALCDSDCTTATVTNNDYANIKRDLELCGVNVIGNGGFFTYAKPGQQVQVKTQPVTTNCIHWIDHPDQTNYPGYIQMSGTRDYQIYNGCGLFSANYAAESLSLNGAAAAAAKGIPPTQAKVVQAQPAAPSPTPTPWNCTSFFNKVANYNESHWPQGSTAKVQVWREMAKTGNEKGNPTIDNFGSSVKPGQEYFVGGKNDLAYKLWDNNNPNTPFWVAKDAVFCVYPNPYLKATVTPIPPSPTPKPVATTIDTSVPPIANNINYALPNTNLVEKSRVSPLLIIAIALLSLLLVTVFGYFYVLPKSPKTVSSLAKWGLIKPQKAREILEDGLVARAREAIPRLDTLIASINSQLGSVKIKKNKTALSRFLKIASDQRALAQRIADTISENKMVRGIARQTREIVGEVYKLRFNTKFTIEEGDGKIAAELAGLNAYLNALQELDQQIK